MHLLYLPAAVGAALSFAASSLLKHRSAAEVPDAQSLAPGAVSRFVRATVSHRVWLAGLVVDALGLALQVTALHLGPLGGVQALLTLSLPFVVVLRALSDRRVAAVQLGWAGVVAGCLAGLVVLARSSSAVPAAPDHGPAIAAACVGVVLVAGAVAVGRHQRERSRTGLLWGIAVGAIYASTAALLKVATNIAVRDPVHLLISWEFYVLIVVGALGMFLTQLAFQAAPLTATLPAISVTDPLLSIVIGATVFDEHRHLSVAADIGVGMLLVALSVAVIALARRPMESESAELAAATGTVGR